MIYNNKKEYYAVYGTLRLGFGNYENILAPLQPIEERRISGFKMYTNGMFPMIIPSERSRITVEIFEVDDPEIKRRLDGLEGYDPDTNTGMYLRKQIDIGKFKNVNIYVWNRERHKTLNLVDDGDFKTSEKRSVIF
jgi:gamma-glutamylcyclotransferase (GGCT)/AIG2-like uncharacterized protein YtfP